MNKLNRNYYNILICVSCIMDELEKQKIIKEIEDRC